MESTLIKEKKTQTVLRIQISFEVFVSESPADRQDLLHKGLEFKPWWCQQCNAPQWLPLQFSGAAAAVLTQFGKGRRTHATADCLLLLQVINNLRYGTFPNGISPPLVSDVTWRLQVMIWKNGWGRTLPFCRANFSLWKLFDVFCVLAVSFSLLSSVTFCGMLTGDRNVGFSVSLPKCPMAFG